MHLRLSGEGRFLGNRSDARQGLTHLVCNLQKSFVTYYIQRLWYGEESALSGSLTGTRSPWIPLPLIG